jgi:hypothetical protein
MTLDPSQAETTMGSAEGHTGDDAAAPAEIRGESELSGGKPEVGGDGLADGSGEGTGPYLEDEEEDSLVAQLWLFMKEEKKWWLAPILVVVALLFGLLIFADTPAAPFIYTLF